MSASTMFDHVINVVMTAEAAHKESAIDGLVGFFKEGGPFMLINIFWLACALAVVVERVITLMFRYNLNAPPLMEQLTKLVLTGTVARAVRRCGAAPNAPLAKVTRAALTRATRGEIEV